MCHCFGLSCYWSVIRCVHLFYTRPWLDCLFTVYPVVSLLQFTLLCLCYSQQAEHRDWQKTKHGGWNRWVLRLTKPWACLNETEHGDVPLRNREWDGCNVWDMMLRVVCSQRARENRKMSAVWFCPLMPVVMVVMQVRRGCLRSANKYSRIRTEQGEGSGSQCQYTAVLNSHPCTHVHSHIHSYTVL